MSYAPAYTQSIALMVSIGAQALLRNIVWVPASSLAETLGIPRPTVVNILSRLVAAGLLETREGKSGGVRLVRDAGSISLSDVFEAVERRRPLFNTDLPADPSRTEIMEARRLVMESFAKAEAKMKDELAGVALDTLFGLPRARGKR